MKRRCLDALIWLFHLNHHDGSRQQAESSVESVKRCDGNDALVALNLWHSAGAEPGLAWIADVRDHDLWLGQSKMSATTRPSVSLPERLFVCDCECVRVRVWRRKQRLILLPALMWARMWTSVPRRSSICMLSSSQSSRPLIIHIELLKTCHVLIIIKHVSSTKCSFEEHPNSSRKEDYKMCGSLLGNKHD